MMHHNVIAIFGKSRSGKNTVGDMIAARHKAAVQIAFADKLKQICAELFGLTHEDMNTAEGKARPTKLVCPTCPMCKSIDIETLQATVAFSSFYDSPVVDTKGPVQRICHGCGATAPAESFVGHWTPRTIMQFLATEGVRRIDPKAWARYAMREAADHLSENSVREVGEPRPSLVVITDGRFRSELDAVREAGGIAWRVRRPETDDQSTGIARHVSETEIDGIPDEAFDETLMNVGSLADLDALVQGALSRARSRAA